VILWHVGDADSLSALVVGDDAASAASFLVIPKGRGPTFFEIDTAPVVFLQQLATPADRAGLDATEEP
jgi:hypothetical protein